MSEKVEELYLYKNLFTNKSINWLIQIKFSVVNNFFKLNIVEFVDLILGLQKIFNMSYHTACTWNNKQLSLFLNQERWKKLHDMYEF